MTSSIQNRPATATFPTLPPETSPSTDAATTQPPSRRNSIAVDGRFEALNSFQKGPATGAARPAPGRRNSDATGLKDAAPMLAAVHARALEELKPLHVAYAAIRKTGSLDDVLRLIEPLTQANAAKAGIAGLAPADLPKYTEHAAIRMTTMIRDAAGQLPKQTLDNCIDTVGKLPDGRAKTEATSELASMLNLFDPDLEQGAFERISAQITNYPPHCRLGALESLANNVFKTRNPVSAASWDNFGGNLDKVLAHVDGISDADARRAKILTPIAMNFPYYVMSGRPDWIEHFRHMVTTTGNASKQTQAAVVPVMENALTFCEQAVPALITRKDFNDAQATLAELRTNLAKRQ